MAHALSLAFGKWLRPPDDWPAWVALYALPRSKHNRFPQGKMVAAVRWPWPGGLSAHPSGNPHLTGIRMRRWSWAPFVGAGDPGGAVRGPKAWHRLSAVTDPDGMPRPMGQIGMGGETGSFPPDMPGR